MLKGVKSEKYDLLDFIRSRYYRSFVYFLLCLKDQITCKDVLYKIWEYVKPSIYKNKKITENSMKNINILKKLLENGSDPNIQLEGYDVYEFRNIINCRSNFHATPFYYAIVHENIEAVKLFLKYGSKADNKTAICCIYSNLEIIKLLFNGLNRYLFNQSHNYYLVRLIRLNKLNMIKYFIQDLGINPTHEAIKYAIDHHKYDILKYLLDYI